MEYELALKVKNYSDGIATIKTLVSEFQEQTNSSSVLDFSVWLDNKKERTIVLLKEEQQHKRMKQ